MGTWEHLETNKLRMFLENLCISRKTALLQLWVNSHNKKAAGVGHTTRQRAPAAGSAEKGKGKSNM